MKTITTFLLYAASVFCISAQNITEVINYDKPLEFKCNSDFNLTGISTTDTIWDYINRATSLYMYSNNSGYISGKNGLYDAFGIHMTRNLGPNDTMRLNSVFFIAGLKKIKGGSDFFSISVCSQFDSIIGAFGFCYPKAFSMDDVDTSLSSGGLNFFDFNSIYPRVFDDFFVVVDLTGVNDTIAIPTSDPNAGDGKNENRFWVHYAQHQSANPVWYTADNLYGGFNADVCIGAIVTISGPTPPASVSTSEKELLFNTKVFPNPSNGKLTLISFASGQNTYLIKIFDMSGKEIYKEKVLETGTLNHTIDLSEIHKGLFMINITTENGASFSNQLFIK